MLRFHLRFALLIVFIFSLSLVVCAQSKRVPTATKPTPTPTPTPAPCDLTSDKLPALRGLKLGMSFDEATKISRYKVENKLDDYGLQEVQISSLLEEYRDNIDFISIVFFENKISKFSIFYGHGIKFGNADDVENILRDTLNLPSFVKFNLLGGRARFLSCKDFEISFNTVNENYFILRVEDTNAEKAIALRKKEVDEKKRKAFKP